MAKKKFTRPEMEFISKSTIEAVDGAADETTAPAGRTPAEPPAGYKLNPKYVEVKSKRVQLVMQPTMYDRAKAAAKKDNLSFNEYIHRLIDEATTKGE